MRTDFLVGTSVVRKMGMSEDYKGCVTPIRSDIFDIFERHNQNSPRVLEQDLLSFGTVCNCVLSRC
jgi:hypothetical protein